MDRSAWMAWLQKLSPFEAELQRFSRRQGHLPDEAQMFHLLLEDKGIERDLHEEYLRDFADVPEEQYGSRKYSHNLQEENWFSPDNGIVLSRHGRYMPAFRHQHRFIEAVYILSGSAEQTIYIENDREDHFCMKEGDFCIVPPRMEHAIVADDENSIVINIMIRMAVMKDQLSVMMDENRTLFRFFLYTLYENQSPNYILMHAQDDEQIRGLVLDMAAEYAGSRPSSQKVLLLELGILFTLLERDHGEHISFSEQISSGIAYIPQVLQYIERNYRSTDVSDIAEHFSFSRSYLARIFREYTHETVGDTIRHIRTDRAAQALKNTDLSVREIAENVGYDDPTCFIRAFRRVKGKTPLQYRKEYQKGQ